MHAAQHKARALAYQLGEILAVYDECLAQWRKDPGDLGRYERMQAHLDLLRVVADKAFPGGRMEVGELLRSHQDFKLALLRRHMARNLQQSALDAMERDLGARQLRHAALVAALADICSQESEPQSP